MSSILLVRHGQASFGAADYDDLSPTGHEQSRVLGAALAARGVGADLVVAGEMRRHAQTAASLLDGAGWAPARRDRGHCPRTGARCHHVRDARALLAPRPDGAVR